MPCAPTLALPLIDAAQKDALQHLSAAQHAVLLWLAACGGERGVPASAFKPAGVTYASVSALENLGLVATTKAPEGGLLYRNALVFPNSPLQTPAKGASQTLTLNERLALRWFLARHRQTYEGSVTVTQCRGAGVSNKTLESLIERRLVDSWVGERGDFPCRLYRASGRALRMNKGEPI